jgi:hypothetical protein
VTTTESTNGRAPEGSWWPEKSDNGGAWWAGATNASETVAPAAATETRPPPPPPPPPAAPPQTAVVPQMSPAPPAHPTPPAAIAVPASADPDRDGWAAGPPAAAPVAVAVEPAQAAAVVPVVPAVAKVRWVDGVRARFASRSGRYRFAMPLVVVVAALLLLFAGLKVIGGAIAAGLGSTITEHDATLTSEIAKLQQPAEQHVYVTSVLGWLPCPLNPDAAGMIGYNADGVTLIEKRAQAVDKQAAGLLAYAKPAEFRITKPDATHLRVFIGEPTTGVPMLDCGATAAEAPPATSPPTTKGLTAGS